MASTLVLNDSRRTFSGTRKNVIAKVALSFSDLLSINLALFLSAADRKSVV